MYKTLSKTLVHVAPLLVSKKAILLQRKPYDAAVNYYRYQSVQAVVCFIWQF